MTNEKKFKPAELSSKNVELFRNMEEKLRMETGKDIVLIAYENEDKDKDKDKKKGGG